MNKRRRTALTISIAAVLGGVTWLAARVPGDEPVYEGKPLEVWLLGYRSPEPGRYEKAAEITRLAGTNAIPTLLRMLEADDPPLKRNVMGFIHERSGYRVTYVSSVIRNCAAANACGQLGKQAATAVPALTRLLTSRDAPVRSAATNALERIELDTLMRPR
jgi:hypothetical protein